MAEEVRNLATRSANAASSLVELSMKEVELGVERAGQTDVILKEIVSEVEKSNDLVSRIAESSRGQNLGILEIFNGISQINDSVPQNSAIFRQTATSSELLLNQSASLQREIEKFVLFDFGVEIVVQTEVEEPKALPYFVVSSR